VAAPVGVEAPVGVAAPVEAPAAWFNVRAVRNAWIAAALLP